MSRLPFSLTGLVLFCAITLFGQTPNRPVPARIPAYEFVLHDSSYQGYYLTAPFRLGAGAAGAPPAAMILDSRGYLLWYMLPDALNLIDFKFHPGTQQYQFVRYKSPQQVWFTLMDTGFNPVDSFTTVNGILPDIHDFQISKNNTFLLAGASDSVMNLSTYLFDGVPGNANTHAIGFVVQEFDANHQLLFQWDSNDHIHPGDTYAGYGYNANNFDYCHGNAIEEDADGNLLLSFRNLDAVYKIERQTGAVLWILGGKKSTFAFPNDAGFSGQHDARLLPNGHIALFDNANMAAPPKISRAVEYSLDTVNGVATKVWEYLYNPAFFSPAMGGHQTTTDRRHLINYGLNYRPNPSMVLVDDAGKLLSELFFADSFMSYRAYLSDLPLNGVQRPQISCSQNGGTVTLSAPSGYDRYAWSTGEDAASISVSGTGTYQLWVNQGTGMLGSEPFVIEDLSMACPASGVSEAGAGKDQTIIGYYDLLGRAVAAPVPQSGNPGRLYMVRFADGRAKIVLY